MTLFRGYADDLPLMEWLEDHIWPVEKRMSDDDVYWGTRLACVEMIRSGTTCFWDMYWHAHAAARAVEDAGVRAVTAAPLIDDADPAKSERACADADAQPRADRRARRRAGTARVRAARDLHGLASARCAGWPSGRPSSDVPVQIHLSETAGEVEGCVADHGMRPAAWLDRCGLLGPRTVLAHGVWLDARRAGADRRARRDGRHQPGREHEAGRGRRLPLSGGPRARRVTWGSGPTARVPTTRSTSSPTRRRSPCIQKHVARRSGGGDRGGDVRDRHRPPLGRCWAARRWRRAGPRTSCSSAPAHRSWRPAS